MKSKQNPMWIEPGVDFSAMDREKSDAQELRFYSVLLESDLRAEIRTMLEASGFSEATPGHWEKDGVPLFSPEGSLRHRDLQLRVQMHSLLAGVADLVKGREQSVLAACYRAYVAGVTHGERKAYARREQGSGRESKRTDRFREIDAALDRARKKRLNVQASDVHRECNGELADMKAKAFGTLFSEYRKANPGKFSRK
ncbi:MAG: hypothetical protein NDI75_01350 [Candidatus Didemnitutus sp.]|nr:hypothetical protein [Candidatus Didemnitutus sp.]